MRGKLVFSDFFLRRLGSFGVIIANDPSTTKLCLHTKKKTKIMTSAIMWFENIENEIDIDRWAVGDGYENGLGLSWLDLYVVVIV